MPMFVNFSNHPSDQWEEKQLKEARKYGEVEDFPFPMVSPEMSASDVNRLADEYVDKILKKYGTSATIHVMGEMTFTFAMVSRLKAQGIRCLASTTERNAQMILDGQKLSEFRFVQLREY